MEGYEPSTYGQRWADVYDAWYDDPAEVEATVSFLSDLAGAPGDPTGEAGDPTEAPVDPTGEASGNGNGAARPIVELGVGTGRLALPLAARGFDVRGLDTSAAMLDVLRAKPGSDALALPGEHDGDIEHAADIEHAGDMVRLIVPSRPGDPATGVRCRGVFVAYNTFFALTTEQDQRACLARVAEVLEPGGWFVLAAFVPDDGVVDNGVADGVPDRRAGDVSVRSIDTNRVVLTADIVDRQRQTVSGQFIDISNAGIQLRPFHLRYLFPGQIDAMAAEAGLVLSQRWSSWRRDLFDEHSDTHVSVYLKQPPAEPAEPAATAPGPDQ